MDRICRRVPTYPAILDVYAADIDAVGGWPIEWPPVVLVGPRNPLYIFDGGHRVGAAWRCGLVAVWAVVYASRGRAMEAGAYPTFVIERLPVTRARALVLDHHG